MLIRIFMQALGHSVGTRLASLALTLVCGVTGAFVPPAAAQSVGTLEVREVGALSLFGGYGILSGGSSPRDKRKRVFFTSLSGQVVVVENGMLSSQAFLDVTNLLVRDSSNPFEERGLTNITFHPNFRHNGKFYLRYSGISTSGANHDVVIAEYRCTDKKCGAGDPNSGRALFRLPQTQGMHTGGALFFGHDGKLYASFGHGAAIGQPIIHGQDPTELYSALIRIDVDVAFPYAIPADNPFGNEVYAYGFRNPFACNPDRATGEIYCADVGENQREEIDLILQGGNYGFPILEGSACFPSGTRTCTPPFGYIAPVIEYDHTVGTSVQSATIYRGRKIKALRGTMFVADFGNPGIFPAHYFGFTRTASGWNRFIFDVTGVGPAEAPVIVVEDEKGELYFTTVSLADFQTRIYKVVDAKVPDHDDLEQRMRAWYENEHDK